jgi:hypothetical protein
VYARERVCCVLKCNPHLVRLAPQGKTTGFRPAVMVEGRTSVWVRGTSVPAKTSIPKSL